VRRLVDHWYSWHSREGLLVVREGQATSPCWQGNSRFLCAVQLGCITLPRVQARHDQKRCHADQIWHSKADHLVLCYK